LQLGTVYFERTGSPPLFDHTDPAPAYTSLLAGLRRPQVAGVVVLSLDAFGDEKDKRLAELEDDLGVVVHVVDAEDVHDPRD
jgi:PII-like signaling protein